MMLAGDCNRDATEAAAKAASVAASITWSTTSQTSASVASSSVSAAAVDPGSTRSTAQNLGALAGTQTITGTVGGTDTGDVFAFTLSGQSKVSLALSGLSADIDLVLYNSAGTRIALSNRGSTASESISTTLAAGTYYIGVMPWLSASSAYTLTVTGSSTAPPITTTPTAPITTTPTTPTTTTPGTAFPNVTYYGGSNDWNVNSVNAPEAWAQGYKGQGVVVAVVDTGVDTSHPDLTSQIWVNAGEIAGNGIDDDRNGYVDDTSGWDFVNNDNTPTDGNGHGTHVSGTIAADDNGFGATGIAPDAKIMPVRVLDNNGSGTANAVAAGIRYAARNGADIINLSLGGSFSSVIQSAIQYAQSLNVLVVVAAGNEGASVPSYPGRFSATLNNVITVGAYSSSNSIASFSNDVGASGAIQVDAPGVSVYSTIPGNRYALYSGTSMATPHVAGLAALALSANPNLTAAQLRTLIVNGADHAISGSDSRGGIDAALTVALAAAGQTTTATSSTAAVRTLAPVQTVATVRFFQAPDSNGSTPAAPQTPAAEGVASQSVESSVPLAPAAMDSTVHDHAIAALFDLTATERVSNHAGHAHHSAWQFLETLGSLDESDWAEMFLPATALVA
jgi:hypothetical protein